MMTDHKNMGQVQPLQLLYKSNMVFPGSYFDSIYPQTHDLDPENKW